MSKQNVSRRVLNGLGRRFPRAAAAVRPFRPKAWQGRRAFRGMDTEQIFTKILQGGVWDASESCSGAGSTLATTESLRQAFPRLLEELRVRTLLDAPCGDFHWMQALEYEFEFYIGGDIVAPLIEDLKARYETASRRFVVLDVIKDPLPAADIFFCRDCMIHLTNGQITSIIANFVTSDCEYLCASTYPEVKRNIEGITGGSRPVNLMRPPFNLPHPLVTLPDQGVNFHTKAMGLWSKSQLIQVGYAKESI